ncbi:tail protein [Actinocorallia herbida]|uniref:Tail protein n=1 Tax=Actinocorallia herbida TaxID=58109 RepID=A0A3N1CMQ2_9ACTN|nr:phage tail domain-containing protein [Actinocorallia herbida]ROO82573.1 tail protein [Actinocorallia herbida]
MTIPAIEPVNPTSGLLPGAVSRLTATLEAPAANLVIPFNRTDSHGVAWALGGMEGWDSPDMDEGASKRSGSDGLWDTEPWFGGRIVTLSGLITAPTYEAREAAEYRLRAAVPRDKYVTLRVEETTPKFVTCRRSGRPLIKATTDVHSTFSVALLCPDPRKYSITPASATIAVLPSTGGLAPPWTPPVLLPEIPVGPSQALLTNLGDYYSPPVITLRGPGSDLSIHNLTTGQYLAFEQVLGSSDWLQIDTASGTVLLNGTAVRAPKTGSTVVARFLADPGDNLYRLFGTLTAPTPPSADIALYSAWI